MALGSRADHYRVVVIPSLALRQHFTKVPWRNLEWHWALECVSEAGWDMSLADWLAQQWALLREYGLIDDDRLGEREE